MDSDQPRPRQPLNPFSMSMLACIVGGVAGLGAVVFRAMIAFFHNLLFSGKVSFFYEANLHTPPGPWGPYIILVPIVGAAGVAYLVSNFAPEAKGHGVPEVMDTIYYNRGIIRPIVAVVKSIASALSIGSGGSIGREGPIIQIGSSFGSTLGQWISMPAWQRITLLAAGTGGGIAATFNTPIGGLLFAVEIMLQEVSVRTLVPVAIATATATYVGQVFFGTYPVFRIPTLETPYFLLTNPVVLLSYAGLGILTGVASALYIRSLYKFEDIFDNRIGGSYYRKHILGMLPVGIVIYGCMHFFGHYYVEGVGYAAIEDVLTGHLASVYLMGLLFFLKLLVTSLTLGSGASGGIFSPALYLGATLGGAYGVLLRHIFPGLDISFPAFAVAGMAGIVAGSTGATMTAIVMIFEMTLDYNVVLPLTITVALSYGVRWTICRESIYTLKLARRGHYMPQALQTDFQYLKRASQIMESRIAAIAASTTLSEFAELTIGQTSVDYFIVVEDHTIIGSVSIRAALNALDESAGKRTLGEIANRNLTIVSDDATFVQVLRTMRNRQASVAVVSAGSDPLAIENARGIITKQQIADSIAQGIEVLTE